MKHSALFFIGAVALLCGCSLFIPDPPIAVVNSGGDTMTNVFTSFMYFNCDYVGVSIDNKTNDVSTLGSGKMTGWQNLLDSNITAVLILKLTGSSVPVCITNYYAYDYPRFSRWPIKQKKYIYDPINAFYVYGGASVDEYPPIYPYDLK